MIVWYRISCNKAAFIVCCWTTRMDVDVTDADITTSDSV
jgi:hypothetical protein